MDRTLFFWENVVDQKEKSPVPSRRLRSNAFVHVKVGVSRDKLLWRWALPAVCTTWAENYEHTSILLHPYSPPSLKCTTLWIMKKTLDIHTNGRPHHKYLNWAPTTASCHQNPKKQYLSYIAKKNPRRWTDYTKHYLESRQRLKKWEWRMDFN